MIEKYNIMVVGLSSSFDNDLVTPEDDITSSKNKLMDVYETCRRISISSDGGRRLSASYSNNVTIDRLPITEPHSYPCKDTYTNVPPSPPEKWPQRPILLRPSPESGMKIRGIRYSSSYSYLSLPGTGYCGGCTLPINNGLEKAGKCLVIDFESKLFIGTAMLRIKNVCDALNNQSDDTTEDSKANNYFDNRKRTFQGIVRGRFKVPNIPISECITGQIFNHPAGHLPPRIISKGAISIISHLAPQLQARLEGDCPRFLSPLASTAQTVIKRHLEEEEKCNNEPTADQSIEDDVCEPQPSDPSSLLQVLHQSNDKASLPSDSDNTTTRIKIRKKAYDKLFASRNKQPTFDTETEYTFQFFQHLLLFNDFALNFPKPVGKHPLHGMLNGQPLKFMAAHQIQDVGTKGKIIDEQISWLWSFDLWHESLYEDALYHEEQSNTS